MLAPQQAGTSRLDVASDPRVAAPSMLDDAIAVTRELRAQVHDQFQLIALETERAARALTTLVAASVAIGVLCVITWLGLIGAMVLLLISVGVAAANAMFAATALNLIGISILYRFVRRARHNLRFPATLRALRPSSRVANGNAP
jgi:hypothetical protein